MNGNDALKAELDANTVPLDEELRAFKEEALAQLRRQGAHLTRGMTDEQKRQIRAWLTTQPERTLVETRNDLDYITWSAKWAILKYAFPDASIRMSQHWETDEGYHVAVIITAGGVEHEGLGFEPKKSEKQITAYSDIGYKAAYSDAVSRTCILPGVGLLLYMDATLSKALIRFLTGETAPPQPKAASERQAEPEQPRPQTVTAPQDDDDEDHEENAPKRPWWITSSQYPGTCPDCGNEIHKGDTVLFDPNAPKGKKARCSACGGNHERRLRTEPAAREEQARATAKENGVAKPEPSESPEIEYVKAPEDVARWQERAADMPTLSVDALKAAINGTEKQLRNKAIAKYNDASVLRDTRVHFLGSPALDGQPVVALAGYLAWLREQFASHTPAQHP